MFPGCRYQSFLASNIAHAMVKCCSLSSEVVGHEGSTDVCDSSQVGSSEVVHVGHKRSADLCDSPFICFTLLLASHL